MDHLLPQYEKLLAQIADTRTKLKSKLQRDLQSGRIAVEKLFEKPGLLTDAPNAAVKIRGLILDLAVSGQLVAPQSEWQKSPLKSLTTKIGSGATPAGGRESYFSEGIPLIRSMNVHFSGFDPNGLVFLSREQADELCNVIVEADDVLLNITGASIGRVTTAPSEMAGARVNQHVTIIRPLAGLLPAFLTLFLASPMVQRMINEIQVGATRQALTKSMIEQFQIPVPTLAEQRQIVFKVNEVMALLQDLETQLAASRATAASSVEALVSEATAQK